MMEIGRLGTREKFGLIHVLCKENIVRIGFLQGGTRQSTFSMWMCIVIGGEWDGKGGQILLEILKKLLVGSKSISKFFGALIDEFNRFVALQIINCSRLAVFSIAFFCL